VEHDRRSTRAAAEHVALRLHAAHARTGRQRPGAQLGTRQVDQHAAHAAEFAGDAPQVGDHLRPGRGVVVREVHARDVHARLQQRAQQVGVGRGLRRQRHHHVRRASLQPRPQQPLGVPLEPPFAFVDTECVVHVRGGHRARLAEQRVQHVLHAAHRRSHVLLHAAERRQGQCVQLALHRAQVAGAHGEVVREVAGAGALLRGNGGDAARIHALARGDRLEQFVDRAEQRAQAFGLEPKHRRSGIVILAAASARSRA
jgi:hypothetical protein